MDDAVFAPVVKRVKVDLEIGSAFRLFTAGMGEWWPLGTHSIAADTHEGRVKAESLLFEEQEGGRIIEVMSDGTEATWGRVLRWEPPDLVVFTWKPNLSDAPHTEVEVRFASTDQGTEVVLEHRGWDRLGDDGVSKRSGYDSGWPRVLELYRSAASG